MVQNHVIEDMAPVAKGRALTTPEAVDADGDDGLFFNALLYPNRSLPNGGFIALMAVVIAVNLFSAIYYTVLGAWPVMFFAGLDVLAVYVAFRISYRQGRLHERVMLTGDHLWVSRVLPSGHETRWRLQPFWTRLSIDRPVRHESQLVLESGGRRLVLGSFLSPAERGELADALRAALDKAKTTVPTQGRPLDPASSARQEGGRNE